MHRAARIRQLHTRRVVVTGIGSVTPLGCDLEKVWKAVVAGRTGVVSAGSIAKDGEDISDTRIPRVVPPGVDVHCVAKVPREVDPAACDITPFQGKYGRQYSDFIQYAFAASDMALNHAGFEKTTDTGVAADEGTDKTATSLDDIDRNRAGVAISSGIGSISDTVEQYDNMKTSYKKVSPYFVPKILVNMASGSVSIRHGLRGPCHAVATACAAGSHAIGDAYNFIRLGYADMMLTGGTEASVDALSITGFARMKALSNTNVAEEASRPFDRKRNGFVIGEGACVLVLEELEHVLKRGAEDKIVCEVVGYGLSGDAHHPTVPSGDGAQRSMLCALRDAGIHPSKVGYINAHATSTPLGDAAEVAAIERVFGCDATGSFGDSLHRSAAEDIPQSGLQRPDDGVEGIGPLFVSSTKGATGHLLGAAGAIESAFCCLALRDGLVPPTLNLSDPDPLPSVNEQTGKPIFFHVPNEGVSYANADENLAGGSLTYAMNNSFGFGGTNASIVYAKYTPV